MRQRYGGIAVELQALRHAASLPAQCRKKALRPKRFTARRETSLKHPPSSSITPPGKPGFERGSSRMSDQRKERVVSTVALSRNPSRTFPGLKAVGSLGNSIWGALAAYIRTGKDRRVLQTLPDNVLADMGLEKIEITRGTDGARQVWVVPHRYY
jgi:uncharacterized protein YjiS (DUF1127 family)